MTQYKLVDGSVIQGNNAAELINAIRGSVWEQELSLSEYMGKLQERVKIYSGHDIRSDTPDNCLADLITAKYLEIVP